MSFSATLFLLNVQSLECSNYTVTRMEYSLKTSSLSLFFVPSTRYTLCPSRVYSLPEETKNQEKYIGIQKA